MRDKDRKIKERQRLNVCVRERQRLCGVERERAGCKQEIEVLKVFRTGVKKSFLASQ